MTFIEAKNWGKTAEIILLHEGLGSLSTWGNFPQKLHETTGLGVHAFSRRSYGQSDEKPLPWHPNYLHEEADFLKTYLDKIGFEKGFLLGHSDGASIATIYQGQFQDTRVQGLSLIAPHFFVEDISIQSIQEAKNIYETTDWKEKLQRHHKNPEVAFRGWNGAWLNAKFSELNLIPLLPKITCPVQLIQGREDPYGTLRQVLESAPKFGGDVETHILSQCGHNPVKERAQETLDILKNFVQPNPVSNKGMQ